MKERPILFSGAMVSAILDGTKTQTRRVVKPQPYIDEMGNACWNGSNFGQSADKVPHFQGLASPIPSSKTKRIHCPYGKPGDRLWVRETFAYSVIDPEGLPPGDDPENYDIIYRAAYQEGGGWRDGEGNPIKAPWKPSIHMPRWASRITLLVTGVRVERLQDISEADAIAEGAQWSACGGPQKGSYKAGYAQLWESINGTGSWPANPWVWVIEFEVVK